MNDGTRILLVEDDPALATEVARAVEREGWTVDRVSRLSEAVEAVLQARFRAVLLDRRLPDGDGLALIPILRSRPPSPQVIVLTARDEISDRVQGLDAGADDYLVKPFALGELLARLRVACRRRPEAGPPQPIKVGRLTFDPVTREAEVGGVPFPLQRRELALLSVLTMRAGRVVQRTHLDSELYGFDSDVSPNALETHVSRLRRRLQDLDAGVELRTIRGVGYLLQAC